jgi:hypothetical protein
MIDAKDFAPRDTVRHTPRTDIPGAQNRKPAYGKVQSANAKYVYVKFPNINTRAVIREQLERVVVE